MTPGRWANSPSKSSGLLDAHIAGSGLRPDPKMRHPRKADHERGTAGCPIGDASACRRQEDQGVVHEQVVGEAKPGPGNRRRMADLGHEPVLNPPDRLAALVLVENDLMRLPGGSIGQRPAECRVEAEGYGKRRCVLVRHHGPVDENRARNLVRHIEPEGERIGDQGLGP